jgi:hypothetical protein
VSADAAGRISAHDPVVGAYKKDVDRTLLRENLGTTPTERLEELTALTRSFEEVRRAGRRLRGGR